jgi:Carboxypeptidase regulatory-like domain
MCRNSELFPVTFRNHLRVVAFRLFLFPFQFIFITSISSSVTWSQDASTGALRGVVLDAQGAVITDADIVAIRVETGIRYHSGTDSAGRFAVDLLPPGNYSARAEAEGMSPQVSPALRVEIGGATMLTFKLTVAGPKETITVSDSPRLLEMNPSSVSDLIDEHAIKNLPLNGRRFTDLLLLTPGVTQDPRGLTSGSNGDRSYGGIRGYNTSFLVDEAEHIAKLRDKQHVLRSGKPDYELFDWAHAIDNGQDALVAGQPATVQNSYAANSEKASSVTDQRQRLTISAIEEPNPFGDGQKALATILNHWKISGIMTYGSGRPANAMVSGDPNQDGNTSNDRLSGHGRNAFVGPDYASMDLRISRTIKTIKLSERFHLVLPANRSIYLIATT